MRKQFFVPAMAAALSLLAPLATRADYSNTVMSLHPIGYWPMTENVQPPEPVVPAASNLGSLGTAFNASFSGDTIFGYPGALAGTTDSADSFNGFETRAVAPYGSEVSTGPSFTIEAWLLTHDDGTLWGTTCPLSDMNANDPRSGWLIYLNVANIGQYTFRTYNQNGTTASLSLNLGAAGSIQSEKWYHVAIVVSNAVTVTNVYGFINGALVAGPVALPGYVPNDGTAGSFTIAGRSDGDGYDFTGAIDEVAYYTAALDGATILAHYQAGTNASPVTPYPTLVQQSHPALYYRMDEAPLGQPYPVALPVAANYGSLGAAANGFYQPGTQAGVPGPTNAGFGAISRAVGLSKTGTQSSGQAGPGVVCAPYSQPALNSEAAVTLTAWIHVPPGAPAWFQTPVGRGDNSYRFDVEQNGMPHFAAAPNPDAVGTVAVNDDQWHFWAGVFDPATTKSTLYIDSIKVAEGAGSPMVNLTCYLMAGGAPDYNDRNFVGDVCHVALFTNALSAGQIATLYNSVGAPPSVVLPASTLTLNEGANGGITATVVGTPPLTIQWYYLDHSGLTNIATGQTSATLSFTNVQASQNGLSYFLSVSNAYGAVTSSIVALTVVQGPPTIQVDVTPAAQQVPIGANVTYSVLVTGTLPFHYQWSRDGSPVSGATASAYSFPALSGSHTYRCTVTNSFGSVNSSSSTVTGVSTPPPVITFNTTGTGWTINQNANPNAAITNGTFLVTDGNNSEAASAFFNTPQYNGGFAVMFTYQGAAGSGGLADGATFCLQNSAAGASALGGGGGSLGLYGIENSAAFELNIFLYANGGRGIQFGTNGMTADTTIATAPYMSTAPVDLASGHPINVQLYFNQGVYYVQLKDATTGDSFATTSTLGDMRSAIGADSAYVGFTGATGGENAIQTIGNFRFSYTTPPALSVVKSATDVVIAWPVSVATFFKLQQSSSVSGPWTNVVPTAVVVGLQNQVTLPAPDPAQFYRLMLQ